MRLIYVVSWRLSQFLAFACCVALAFVTVAICYDVTLRNIGLQPPRSARLACALQHILRDDDGHDRERIVPASDTTPPARGAPA